MPRFNNTPPDDRPNWARLNEGQRRYAWEQYNLALVRRGMPIDHPVPGTSGQSHQYTGVGRGSQQPTEREPDFAEALGAGEEETEAHRQAVEDFDESYFEGVSENAGHQPAGHRNSSDMADSSMTPSKPSGNKRPNSDALEGARKRLPGTAQGQGEQGGNGLGEDSARPFRLPKPIISVHDHVRYYRKVHRFFTYGYAYKTLEFPSDSISMTTPLAQIPWDWLHFYINPAEFSQLPNQASVNNVKVSVYQRNVRVAFPTNSTANALATLNQNKNIIYAHGLNKKCDIFHGKYTTFQDNQPMIPTATTFWTTTMWRDDANNWYGSNDNTQGPSRVTPRHQMGQPDVLQCYAHLRYLKNPDGNNAHDGFECLQSYVTESDADATSGGLLCQFEYHPVIGLCKKPHKQINRAWGAGTWGIPRGSHNLEPHETRVTVALDKVTGTTSNISAVDQTFALDSPVQVIEKSQIYHEGIFNRDGPHVQDSLHVGVQPTYALTSTNTNVNNSFTDTQALFEVVAECWVNTCYPTSRPLTLETHSRLGNMWTHNTDNVYLNYTTMDGLNARLIT